MPPDTLRARTGPPAAEPMVTPPLTVRTIASPWTRSIRIVPDTVDTSAAPAAPTVIDPLLVAIRQPPRQSPTSTRPDFVRRSASVDSATRIEPLADVMLTAPSDPRTSTLPDAVPMTRSQNRGHRTSSEPDGRSGRISTMPPATGTALPPGSTTMLVRSSALTVTLPDVVAMRSWSRPGGPSHHCRRRDGTGHARRRSGAVARDTSPRLAQRLAPIRPRRAKPHRYSPADARRLGGQRRRCRGRRVDVTEPELVASVIV